MKQETRNAKDLASQIWFMCKKHKGEGISTLAMERIVRSALVVIGCKVVCREPLNDHYTGDERK